jgi:hypothetical protein
MRHVMAVMSGSAAMAAHLLPPLALPGLHAGEGSGVRDRPELDALRNLLDALQLPCAPGLEDRGAGAVADYRRRGCQVKHRPADHDAGAERGGNGQGGDERSDAGALQGALDRGHGGTPLSVGSG